MIKPRILIITQHFPPEKSGNASRIYDISRNLVKLGVQVTVFSPYPTFPHGSFKKTWKASSSRIVEGIKLVNIFTWQPNASNPIFLSRMGYYLIFPIISIFYALKNRKEFDVIITSSPPAFIAIPGLFIKKLTRKIWFFDVRDLWIDASVSLGFIKKDSLFEKMSKTFEKICYHACDTITATTEEIKKVISTSYVISPDKIKILSNGVDTSVFIPSDVKKNRIIYAGNIGHAQDLEKMILAVKKIKKRFPIEFYIVGDGDIKKDLERIVVEEDLVDTVIFTGVLKRENVPQLIAESLIGVAPLKNLESLKYALPTKTYEYMSCGTPFLAMGTGEIENLAKVSGAGVVAKSSVKSIYEHMVKLLEDEELMKQMGKNGRAFAKKYCDRRKSAESLLESIENVIT